MKNKNPFIIVCEKCHGLNIETKAWVDANDDTVLDSVSDGDIGNNWCRDCEEHVNFINQVDII